MKNKKSKNTTKNLSQENIIQNYFTVVSYDTLKSILYSNGMEFDEETFQSFQEQKFVLIYTYNYIFLKENEIKREIKFVPLFQFLDFLIEQRHSFLEVDINVMETFIKNIYTKNASLAGKILDEI